MLLYHSDGANACGSLERRVVLRLAVEVVEEGGAFPLEHGVPVALNGVIGPAVEEAGDGGPLVVEPRVGPNYSVVLVGGERSVPHLRRELVAPPQTTGGINLLIRDQFLGP